MTTRGLFGSVSLLRMAAALALVVLSVLALRPEGQAALAGPGTGTLFGTSGGTPGGSSVLLRINPVTGTGVPVAPLGVSVPALANDNATGILYGGTGAGGAFLIRIDKVTGTPTVVGDTGLGFAAIGDMDFSPSGLLYPAST